MEQIWMVLLFAAVILIITLIAGYLPFLMNRNPEHMHFLIAFSAGVMLGVLFIMLPPEALERTLDAGHSLHTAFYMILVGFVLLLFIDFIVKKYYDPGINVSMMAELLHVHRITLNRLFQAAYGISPGKYLNNVRLQEAIRLLTESDLPVKEVARNCGYESAGYFTKILHRQTGHTPRSFRSRKAT